MAPGSASPSAAAGELMGGICGSPASGRGLDVLGQVRLPLAAEGPTCARLRLSRPASAPSSWTTTPSTGASISSVSLSWGMRRIASLPRNGPSAALRRRCRAHPYRIALIDFEMPDGEGAMLGRALFADPACGDVAVVLMTSADQLSSVEQLPAAGFAAYLVKPVLPLIFMKAMCRPGREPGGTNSGLVTHHTLIAERGRAAPALTRRGRPSSPGPASPRTIPSTSRWRRRAPQARPGRLAADARRRRAAARRPIIPRSWTARCRTRTFTATADSAAETSGARTPSWR